DDLIVSADGRITRQMNDLAGILQGRAPGDRVTLTVLRNQQDRTVNVVLGRRPQTTEGPALIPPRTAQAPAVNSAAAKPPAETTARRPPPPPQPEAINPGRTAEAKSDQSRIDLLERRIAELERRLSELERLLSRRP